jgi:hypothetical protein
MANKDFADLPIRTPSQNRVLLLPPRLGGLKLFTKMAKLPDLPELLTNQAFLPNFALRQARRLAQILLLE